MVKIKKQILNLLTMMVLVQSSHSSETEREDPQFSEVGVISSSSTSSLEFYDEVKLGKIVGIHESTSLKVFYRTLVMKLENYISACRNISSGLIPYKPTNKRKAVGYTATALNGGMSAATKAGDLLLDNTGVIDDFVPDMPEDLQKAKGALFGVLGWARKNQFSNKAEKVIDASKKSAEMTISTQEYNSYKRIAYLAGTQNESSKWITEFGNLITSIFEDQINKLTFEGENRGSLKIKEQATNFLSKNNLVYVEKKGGAGALANFVFHKCISFLESQTKNDLEPLDLPEYIYFSVIKSCCDSLTKRSITRKLRKMISPEEVSTIDTSLRWTTVGLFAGTPLLYEGRKYIGKDTFNLDQYGQRRGTKFEIDKLELHVQSEKESLRNEYLQDDSLFENPTNTDKICTNPNFKMHLFKYISDKKNQDVINFESAIKENSNFFYRLGKLSLQSVNQKKTITVNDIGAYPYEIDFMDYLFHYNLIHEDDNKEFYITNISVLEHLLSYNIACYLSGISNTNEADTFFRHAKNQGFSQYYKYITAYILMINGDQKKASSALLKFMDRLHKEKLEVERENILYEVLLYKGEKSQ